VRWLVLAGFLVACGSPPWARYNDDDLSPIAATPAEKLPSDGWAETTQSSRASSGPLPGGAGDRRHLERVRADPLDAAALNKAVERVISRCPAQYLWGYNRYKVPAGAEPPPVVAS